MPFKRTVRSSWWVFVQSSSNLHFDPLQTPAFCTINVPMQSLAFTDARHTSTSARLLDTALIQMKLTARFPIVASLMANSPIPVSRAGQIDKQTGSFFLPADCNSYYQCSNGRMKLRKCRAGLHWNDNTKSCDLPESAGCVSARNTSPRQHAAEKSLTPVCSETEMYFPYPGEPN